VLLAGPAQLSRMRGHGVPHPRCPAARTFDWSSLNLPHPDSPAARYFEWTSSILPHPDSPSARGYLWGTGSNGVDHSADREQQAVTTSLDEHADNLRDALPDPGLQAIYDRQISALKMPFGFTRPTIVDRALVLRDVKRQIDWVHCHLQSTLSKSYETAVRPILVEFDALQAQAIYGDKGTLLSDIQAVSERYYQTAIESIQEDLAQVRKTGKEQELIHRWRARMLVCASGGSAGGAEELVEEPQAPQKKPPKKSESSEAAIKTWIAIQLTDEDGNPVPDAAYSVTLPDGSVMTGSLDDQGFARFDDIDPGKCLVSFPEIHAKEWKPV
jgi:hypothetical protein